MWLEKWTPDWKVSALFTPNPSLSNIRFNTDLSTRWLINLNELSCRWGSRHQNVCKLKSGTNWADSPLLDRSGFLGTEFLLSTLSTEDISPRFTKLVKYYRNTCLSTNSDCQSRVSVYQLDISKKPSYQIVESHVKLGFSPRAAESGSNATWTSPSSLSEQHATE